MNSYYLCALITAASALTSLGFSIVAFMAADRASKATASYAAARSVALAVTSLIPLVYVSISFLSGIAIAMIVAQGLDALIGFKLSDRVKTYGPAITAAVNLTALIWLR